MMVTIISIEDVTADWLSSILNTKILSFTSNRIGTGQIGEVHRLELKYDAIPSGPPSIVITIAASDESSRETGFSQGLY